MVLAGPGAGKTRALTYRIAHLIRERGVAPAQILAVTFTNRAAEEMRRRVRALLPDVEDLGELTVGTFHSIALDFLNAYQPEDAKSVVDDLEAREILADAIADSDVSIRPAAAQAAISAAKAGGTGPEDLEGDGDLRAVYRAYQDRLSAYRVRDYDDILLDLLRLLEGDPETLAHIRGRIAHLLVDEFQDVNAVQYRLVVLMAGAGEGLFAIGDPDQAIYGFRGASPAFFGSLLEDFPSARKVVLDTTYRSTPQIVQAASAVIAHNADREPVRLVAVRGDGPVVRLLSVPGETAEGIAVVREIGRMVGGADMLQSHGEGGRTRGDSEEEERSFSDFGVLFRTGRQADVLEECFVKEGLPYRIVGQKGFLEAEPVRRALAFFR